MLQLQWTPDMETGIEVVDRQHRELVEQVNRLLQAMRAGKGRKVVGDLLAFLGRYAVEHFQTEEEIMRKGGYPEYERHRAVHEAFKRDFAKLAAEYEKQANTKLALTIEVQKRVMEWLRQHILKTDKKAAEHLREHGAV